MTTSATLTPSDVSLLARVADGLDPQDDPYASDPVGWIREELREEVWSKQQEVLESVLHNRFTSVKSAHSTGKSHIASRAAAWWGSTHPPEDTFIVTTAPSANQVEGILWRYIGAAHSKYQLIGRIVNGPVPSWKIDGALIGWGRKPQDLSNAEQAATVFQGIHARHLLVILDEAGGIPEWLWNAVNTLVSDEGGRGRVLAIGNPDDPGSHFARIDAPGTKWNKIQIKAFDSPNFIGDPRYTGTYEMEQQDRDLPDDLTSMLVGPTFVADAASDWGEESPLYVSKVDAEFPDSSDDTLIKMSWIKAAMERDLSGEAALDLGQAAMDVARTGPDETCLGHNRGGMFRVIRSKRGLGDTMKAAGWIKSFNLGHPAVPIIVDADGLGAGVFDRGAELRLPVSPFHGGHRAFKPRRFVNRRSEQWWAVRQLFEAGLFDIDADDLRLQAQLGSIKFEEDSAGRISVETKKQMAKRGLPSPDRGDTLMMVTAPATDYSASFREPDGTNRPKDETVTGDLLEVEW